MPFRRRRDTTSPTAAAPPSAKTLAFRYLARRDHTPQELIDKLTGRGIATAEAATVVDQLVGAGYIDQARIAAAHVHRATSVKRRGPARVRLELEARGVDPATIRDALATVDPVQMRDAIDQFIAKHAPLPRSPESRARVFRQLLRRGFPADSIRRSLDR